MDGDALLTRDQILKEAESIRLAIEKSSSPSERQQLRSRYDELDILLRSAKAKKSEPNRESSPSPTATIPPDSRKCPFCAEIIKIEAVKCRFCGEFLDGSRKPESNGEQKEVRINSSGYYNPPSPPPPPSVPNLADIADAIAEGNRRSKKEAETQKAKETLGGCAVLLVLTFVVYFWMGHWWNGVKSDYKKHKDSPAGRAEAEADQLKEESWTAKDMSEEFVKKRLKAPGTAKFPTTVPFMAEKEWSGTKFKDKAGETVWSVKSWVESENSFGAMLRNDYECSMIDNGGGNWQLVMLRLGDDLFFGK